MTRKEPSKSSLLGEPACHLTLLRAAQPCSCQHAFHCRIRHPHTLEPSRHHPSLCPFCSFPGYGYGGRIDELYAKEVQPRLDHEHYLDFTGSGGWVGGWVV